MKLAAAMLVFVITMFSVIADTGLCSGTIIGMPTWRTVVAGKTEEFVVPVEYSGRYLVVRLTYSLLEERIVKQEVLYNTSSKVLSASYNALNNRLYVLFEDSVVAYDINNMETHVWKLQLEHSIVGNVWMYTMRSGGDDYIVVSTLSDIIGQGEVIVIRDLGDHGEAVASIAGAKSRAYLIRGDDAYYLAYERLQPPSNWTLIIRKLVVSGDTLPVVAQIPLYGKIIGLTQEGGDIVFSSSEGAIYRVRMLGSERFNTTRYKVSLDIEMTSNPVLLSLNGHEYIYVGTGSGEVVQLVAPGGNTSIAGIQRKKVSDKPVRVLGYIDLVPDIAEHYIVAYSGSGIYVVNSQLQVKAEKRVASTYAYDPVGLGGRHIYVVTNNAVYRVVVITATQPAITYVWSPSDLAPTSTQGGSAATGSETLYIALVIIAVVVAGVFIALKKIGKKAGGEAPGPAEEKEEGLEDIDVGI